MGNPAVYQSFVIFKSLKFFFLQLTETAWTDAMWTGSCKSWESGSTGGIAFLKISSFTNSRTI
jgi:hypothetical protein